MPPPRVATRLPREVSSFIGRRQQIEAVTAGLRSTRVLTLTGGGGLGKTRLALHVAHEVKSLYETCVWAALSPVVNNEGVIEAVSAALAHAQGGLPNTVESLARRIGDQPLLLVLDNCEHVVGECAELVSQVVEQCGALTVLATSREPLGISGEMVYPVEPLSLPDLEDPPSQHMQSESLQLFLERACAREPRLDMTRETAELAARICRAVGGVPLAIELAAARTGSMALSDIAVRLDDPLEFLSVGPRSGPPRHRSLRASLDWSHNLLEEPEQRLLRRLAMLDGDVTLQDVERLCALDDMPLGGLAFVLDRLVAQSLVQVDRRASTLRFSLTPTVRQYALERLEAGDLASMRARHEQRSPAPVVQATVEPAVLAQRRVRTRHPHLLSERERDVVVLIADGRSNREIADQLVITRKTAEAHVSHILTKLGLCSRVQIATWSLRHGLVSDG